MNNKIKNISVFGTGCPNCKQLFETTKKIAEELKIDAKVEYITDIAKVLELGMMTSPILAVDGVAVLAGSGHSDSDIRDALQNMPAREEESHSCGCCHC